MRLVNSRIETIHSQRKIDRIQVIEIVTSKYEASYGNSGNEKEDVQLPGTHERELLHLRCHSQL